MIKSIINCTVFSILLLAISSCSQSRLSCDDDIDIWAKTHLEEYLNAERDLIVSLPLSRQMAIFIGLTPQKKLDLWYAKLSTILEDSSYSLSDKRIINKLYHKLSVNAIEKDEVGNKLMDECLKIINKLEWDDEKLFFSFGTWMTRDEYYQALWADSPVLTRIETPGDEPHLFCECSKMITNCSAQGLTCYTNVNCEPKQGCGVFGLGLCRGVCDF